MNAQDKINQAAETTVNQYTLPVRVKIKEDWSTDRLTIRKATLDDMTELNRICSSWDNKILLEGSEFSEEELKNSIQNGDLPPIENADRENYYVMVMQGADGKLKGYFDIYHGYPDAETVWIGMFIINKEDQGASYGKEVLESISSQCKVSGWSSMGLGVYLKNWKGLRFWTKNGFNKIIGIYGDKEYSEATFSIIGLKKEITK